MKRTLCGVAAIVAVMLLASVNRSNYSNYIDGTSATNAITLDVPAQTPTNSMQTIYASHLVDVGAMDEVTTFTVYKRTAIKRTNRTKGSDSNGMIYSMTVGATHDAMSIKTGSPEVMLARSPAPVEDNDPKPWMRG